MSILSYLFWPNPPAASYANPKVFLFLCISVAFLVAAFLLKQWRARLQNSVTKKLSSSWSLFSFWFGLSALLLTVARVESIQFLSMRFLWVLWGLSLLLTIVFQVRSFRMRHYAVLPHVHREDPREKYLPGRKRR